MASPRARHSLPFVRFAHPARSRLALALVVALAAGCQARTEIVIGVATDLRAKGQIDLVRFIGARNGVPLFQHEWPLSDVPAGMYELPGSFGVFSSDGSEPRVELSLFAFQGNTMVADRESILSLVSGQTLFLRMGLTSACNVQNGIKCAADESCVEGVCEKRLIDAHKLPKFRPELVTSVDCSSNTHYVVSSTGMPMPVLKSSCPGSDSCHEGTCFHDPPKQQPMLDASFCINEDGGIDDGGVSLRTGTDLRVQSYPILVGLSCSQHFFPFEVTLDVGDSLQISSFAGGSHHISFGTMTSGDIATMPVTETFPTAGDFTLTCVDHPTAGNLVVHVR
jgi:hypothetical protein